MKKRTNHFISGLLALLFVAFSCSRENQAPVALFTIDPTSGNDETIFYFDASACTDPDDAADELMVRWDFDGDDYFDTQYAVKKTSDKKYSDPGTYEVTLVVKDPRGLTDTLRQTLVVGSSNLPPEMPGNPFPENGASNTRNKLRFSWDCIDPDGDPVLYTVYFGSTNPPPSYLTNYTFNSFDPGKLEYGTTYYWKIRARDVKGNSQDGPLWSFSVIPMEFAEMTDNRDGKSYAIVQIGSQWWMAENLNYETPGASWCYDNDPNRCIQYGRLYSWESALEACPEGWHLPTFDEFNTLVNHLGGNSVAGGKLKDYETGYWRDPNAGADNLSGFMALPAGRRYDTGMFAGLGYYAQFYSATPYNDRDAYTLMLGYDYTNSFIYNFRKSYGVSVRCLKD